MEYMFKVNCASCNGVGYTTARERYLGSILHRGIVAVRYLNHEFNWSSGTTASFLLHLNPQTHCPIPKEGRLSSLLCKVLTPVTCLPGAGHPSTFLRGSLFSSFSCGETIVGPLLINMRPLVLPSCGEGRRIAHVQCTSVILPFFIPGFPARLRWETAGNLVPDNPCLMPSPPVNLPIHDMGLWGLVCGASQLSQLQQQLHKGKPSTAGCKMRIAYLRTCTARETRS